MRSFEIHSQKIKILLLNILTVLCNRSKQRKKEPQFPPMQERLSMLWTHTRHSSYSALPSLRGSHSSYERKVSYTFILFKWIPCLLDAQLSLFQLKFCLATKKLFSYIYLFMLCSYPSLHPLPSPSSLSASLAHIFYYLPLNASPLLL